MYVTGIRPHPRAPGRLVIEVDGARFATLPAESVEALGIDDGQHLTDADASRLSYAADVDGAYRVALRLLAARPRSVQEVLRRLRDRGHNPSAAAEAVGRLEDAGLLDDSAFAEHFVRVRAPKGYGRARLLRDLQMRGVDRRLAERAVDAGLESEGVSRTEQVRKLAARRSHQLRHIPIVKRRRRLLAFLERRGFRGRDVTELIEELLSEEPSHA